MRCAQRMGKAKGKREWERKDERERIKPGVRDIE